MHRFTDTSEVTERRKSANIPVPRGNCLIDICQTTSVSKGYSNRLWTDFLLKCSVNWNKVVLK